MKTQTAVFAMGCFWQPDYIFSKIAGVTKTRVGYTGCNKSCVNPTYEQVCSEETNCAEAIEITFNPEIITYEKLLELFWINHDPTTTNRQGPDFGTQYRSAIFCLNEKQKQLANKSKQIWEKRLIEKDKKIVTEITRASTFYPAEDYHQKYLETSGRQCHISRRVFK